MKKCNRNYFKLINSNDKAYWLGFFYADGYVRSNRNCVGIHISKKDINHLEKFKKCLFSNHKIYDEGKYVKLEIGGGRLKKDLIRHGCYINKSKKQTNIPKIKDEFINDFIRGVFDGDGSIYIYNGYPSVSIYGNVSILKSIKTILNNLEIVMSNTKISYCNNTFRLKYNSRRDVVSFLKFIYKDSNIHLDRKYCQAMEVINSHDL